MPILNILNTQLSLDEQKYIYQLVQEELFSMREDYTLCQMLDNSYVYIHKTKLNDTKIDKVISDLEKKQIQKDFLKLKLKHPPLTPVHINFKNELVKHFRNESESSFGKYTRQESLKDANRTNYYEQSIIDKILQFKYLLAGIIFIGIILFAYLFFINKVNGTIKFVDLTKHAKISLNNKEIKLVNNYITNLTEGKYLILIEFDDGTIYKQEQHIFSGDTVNVYVNREFSVNKSNISKKIQRALVKIKTNFPDYQLTIDQKKFKNINDWIALESGSHTFEVAKEGYTSIPSFRAFYLADNDSIEVKFIFENKIRNVNIVRGSIEINTSITGADIYINGKLAEYKSNHIFSEMTEGTYTFAVKKEGFNVIPPEQKIRVVSGQSYYPLDFILTKTSGLLIVKTINAQADIFIDGSKLAFASFNSIYKEGAHTLTFQQVEGYYTPEPKAINIQTTANTLYYAVYNPIINMSGDFSSGNYKSDNFSLTYGIFQYNKFIADESHKAPIIKAKNGLSAIKMGYPFEYNNPKAGHALKLNFNLPQSYNYEQSLYLQFTLKVSSAKYSFTQDDNGKLSILVNNKRKLLNQNFNAEVRDQKIIKKFKINDILINGANEIIIYTSEENNLFFEIEKIELIK